MEPIGLTRKKDGELMVVHSCLNCGKISCNRIAGDDNSYVITSLLERPINFCEQTITRLAGQGVSLLTQNDKQEVLTSLFGHNYERCLRQKLNKLEKD